jgi:hypothetical protein
MTIFSVEFYFAFYFAWFMFYNRMKHYFPEFSEKTKNFKNGSNIKVAVFNFFGLS